MVALTLCTQLALKSMIKVGDKTRGQQGDRMEAQSTKTLAHEILTFRQQHKTDDGQVILVNSLSGHRVVWNATSHFYAASKYAVTGLLEGFRQEVGL